MTVALLSSSRKQPGFSESIPNSRSYADVLSRSVLTGVGRYLSLVVSNQNNMTQDIEPARLVNFPYFDASVPQADLLNGVTIAARFQFLKRATASPKSIPLHMELASTEVDQLHQIRAISTLGRVVLLEHTQLAENGEATGQTYWAQPGTILESPFLHPILAD